MKKLSLFLTFCLAASLSFAQLSFKTGSVELDKDMATINADAELNIKGFKIDLSASHSIPIPKIDQLLKIMSPAEIILAKNISIQINKPLDDVVSSYKVNKDKGWGQIAKEMGIKPGSPEFHALKGKTKGKKDKAKGNSGGKGNSKSKGKGKK